MPERPDTRAQDFLLPPSLDEWTPLDHPVRFIDAFVVQLPATTRCELGLTDGPQALGAPRYAPAMLLRVWLLHERAALGPGPGARLHGPASTALADGQPVPGSQHVVARVQRPSRNNARALHADRAHGGAGGIGRSGADGGRWNQGAGECGGGPLAHRGATDDVVGQDGDRDRGVGGAERGGRRPVAALTAGGIALGAGAALRAWPRRRRPAAM